LELATLVKFFRLPTEESLESVIPSAKELLLMKLPWRPSMATPAKPPILLVLVFPTVFVLMFVFTFAFAFALAFAFAGVLLFVFIVGKFCGGATGL